MHLDVLNSAVSLIFCFLHLHHISMCIFKEYSVGIFFLCLAKANFIARIYVS